MEIKQTPEQHNKNIFWYLRSIWCRLTEPSAAIQDRGQQRKIQLVSTLLLFISLSVLVDMLITLDFSPAMLGFILVTYGLSRTRYYVAAASLTLVLMSAPTFAYILAQTEHSSLVANLPIVWLALPVILSSLLFSLRGTLITIIAILASLFLLPVVVPGLSFYFISFALGFMGMLSGMVLITTYQRTRLENEGRAELEQQVKERTIELSKINESLRQEIQERRRIEQELRQNQERLTLAIVGTGGALWDQELNPNADFDDQPDEMYLSPWEKKLLGYQDDELPHSLLAWDSHVLPEDRAQREKKQREHFAGHTKYYAHEYRVRRKDGSIRWINVRSRIIRNEQGQPLRWIGIDWDITDHKQIEEALQESRVQLKAQYKSNPIPNYTWQRAGDSFVLINYNDAAERITHGQVKNLVGRKAEDIYAEMDAQSHRGMIPEDISRCFHEQTIIEREVVYWIKSIKSKKHFAVKYAFASPDLVLVYTEDITERKQTELALQQAHVEMESHVEVRTAQLTTINRQLQAEIAERRQTQESLQSQTRRLSILHQIDRAITASLDLSEILNLITEQTILLLNVTAASVILHDKSRNDLWFATAVGRGAEFIQGQRLPWGRGIAGWVIEHGESLMILDAQQDDRFFGTFDRSGNFTTHSLLCAPLQAQGHVLGAVEAVNKQSDQFNQDDLQLLESLAMSAAIAIQNARLYTEAQQRLAEQVMLRELGQHLASILEPDTVLRYVAEELCRAVAATSVYISRYEPEIETTTIIAEYMSPQAGADEQVPVVGTTYDLAQVFSDDIEMLRRGQPNIIHANDPETNIQQREHLARYGCQTVLNIPMQIGDQSIAYISVRESRYRRDFTTQEIELCQSIAHQAAISLQNAYLHQQIQRYAAELEQRVSERTKDLTQTNDQLQIEISERRQAEAALRESEERLRSTIASMDDLVFVMDHNGIFIDYYQPEGNSALFRPPEQFLGKSFKTVLPPHIAQSFESVMNIVIATGIGQQFEYSLNIEGDDLWFNAKISRRQSSNTEFAGVTIVARDITGRKLMEEALQQSQARYQAIVETQTEMICRFLPDGTYTFANEAYCRYHGKSNKELVGSNLFSVVPAEGHALIQMQLARISRDNIMTTWDDQIVKPNGEVRWEQWSERGIFDEQGQLIEYQAVGRDITERKLMEAKLEYTAMHDALTGLPNRVLFMDYLKQALTQAKASESYLFAVLFIDLDRFKLINDSLGHAAGDQLLVTIAQRLKECIRPGDVVARLGGDEFVILLNNLPVIDQAQNVANHIQNKLATPIQLNQHQIYTTASIGITTNAREYERPEDILRDADTAMYQAKAKGKARYELFQTSQHNRVQTRLRLETDLWQALERNEFVIYYQPVVSVVSGRITGMEALLRWQHPQRGLISPTEFIPLAEETGLIVPIGSWLLHTACTQAKAWHTAGYGFLRLAVNISARQFQQQDLPGLVKSILQETGLTPYQLDLEITESLILNDNDLNLLALNQLRNMGIRISIDDFGLGSSLNNLKLLPLDVLKIDQSFVQDMSTDAVRSGRGTDAAILTAIITMAHHLNLKVIAEGVETEAQLAFIQSRHCDEAQGYLFGKPMPAEAFTKILQTRPVVMPGFLSKEMEQAIWAETAQKQKIAYALANESLAIIAHNASIKQWASVRDDNLVGQSLADVFPELTGVEETLRRLTRQEQPFIIPKIYRPSADDFGRYFDLQVESFGGQGAALLVIATDVTQYAHMEFELRQERNELRLNIIKTEKLLQKRLGQERVSRQL